MSNDTATVPSDVTPADMQPASLTPTRVLRSEWIKLTSLRSTWWLCAAAVVASCALGLLLAGTSNSVGTTVAPDLQQVLTARTVTTGASVTALVAAVLGVLAVSREYGTGLIRTSFTAVPGRVPVIAAKAVVLAQLLLIVGVLDVVLVRVTATPLLVGQGLSPHWSAGALLLPLLGSVVYPVLVAVLAVGVGTVVRSTAAALTVMLGLLLVAPTALGLLANVLDSAVVADVAAFLPSNAASQVFTVADASQLGSTGTTSLTPWLAMAVLVGWAVVGLGGSLPLVARRDV